MNNRYWDTIRRFCEPTTTTSMSVHEWHEWQWLCHQARLPLPFLMFVNCNYTNKKFLNTGTPVLVLRSHASVLEVCQYDGAQSRIKTECFLPTAVYEWMSLLVIISGRQFWNWCGQFSASSEWLSQCVVSLVLRCGAQGGGRWGVSQDWGKISASAALSPPSSSSSASTSTSCFLPALYDWCHSRCTFTPAAATVFSFRCMTTFPAASL